MKLVGNFFTMSMAKLIAEGNTLAEKKSGLNREAVVHFLKESFQEVSKLSNMNGRFWPLTFRLSDVFVKCSLSPRLKIEYSHSGSYMLCEEDFT